MKFILIATALLFIVACASLSVNKSTKFNKTEHITYKQTAETTLTGDLYIPDISGPKPAVLVVHGGGWSKRSGDMEGISKQLAGAGFVVFNIRYRLAPEYHHPTQMNDVSDALEWLYQHADEYQIDRENISGWGYSAGAHLILMAGLDRAQAPQLRSIIAGGTPADLSRWPNSPLVYKLIGKSMAEAEAEWQDASPVNHVSASSPPVFLYHGQWDKLVEPEQMELMNNALDKKNIPSETYTVSFAGHIMTYLFAGKAERRAIAFIKEQSRTQ
ncbi:Carboxylesterase NlhH [Zhongshania aliphaticivorans]|uniref:Carboxylesterase NlhH n=1 Tax=Zhongshania aliphaticivorans TaxID=1470434 RepID=A0A5S9N775_9GAMM|nr:alpha/beta hydrolase [Zhongshania aliphaticivorans]CAA0080277.1 Carboxylesterase NlhH [Zhongshania aliphaticivorans]CAA0085751.1 Carboxylesterase NlhH [Zhongshania aliphaticivorans]